MRKQVTLKLLDVGCLVCEVPLDEVDALTQTRTCPECECRFSTQILAECRELAISGKWIPFVVGMNADEYGRKHALITLEHSVPYIDGSVQTLRGKSDG